MSNYGGSDRTGRSTCGRAAGLKRLMHQARGRGQAAALAAAALDRPVAATGSLAAALRLAARSPRS